MAQPQNTKATRATRHVSINEALIFEKSAPGKRGMELPPLDVPAVNAAQALGPDYARGRVEGFPEISEIEVIRHFTRLSTWNYAIDLGMYPLGSCTMNGRGSYCHVSTSGRDERAQSIRGLHTELTRNAQNRLDKPKSTGRYSAATVTQVVPSRRFFCARG